MKVTIAVSSHLSEQDTSEIWQFLQQFSYIPYQQFPEYPQIEEISTRYFVAKNNNGVAGWVQVVEKKRILAVIEFGPIANSSEITKELLLFVTQYYKKHHYLFLRWVPYCYENEVYKELCVELQSRYRLMDSSKLIHWSSKRISLAPDAETILKNFSENHRRNIKKAAGLKIECRKISNAAEIETFVNGYAAMYQHRKLHVDPPAVRNSFKKLYHYLKETDRGFFIGAFKENILLGGLIIIFQGTNAFYYKGYIDHEQRTLPINHIAFYEAIVKAKDKNMQWFDFGGYASNTSDEQLQNINRFKDGFKGALIDFPKTQMIGLNYLSRLVHSFLSLKSLGKR